MWREAGVTRETDWRGFVDDVAGHRLYFTGFAGLSDFFRLRLAPSGSDDDKADPRSQTSTLDSFEGDIR